MSDAVDSSPLLELAQDVVRWWTARGVRGVIIGGVAASLVGRPRLTRDLDALVAVPEAELEDFITSGAEFGLHPRVEGALEFARLRRVLLMRSSERQLTLDISLATLPFELETIERASKVSLGGREIPVATGEDLVIMKAVAHRPQDLIDIASILETVAGLDLARVRFWVRQFSEVLEMPEILEDVERLISRRSGGKA